MGGALKLLLQDLGYRVVALVTGYEGYKSSIKQWCWVIRTCGWCWSGPRLSK